MSSSLFRHEGEKEIERSRGEDGVTFLMCEYSNNIRYQSIALEKPFVDFSREFNSILLIFSE